MNFYEEFNAINGEASLRDFLNRYQFQSVQAAPRWNLGEYELRHAGQIFRVGYRWHDPSQAFSIQRDIHKAELWSIDLTGQPHTHGRVQFDQDA